jgi:hypothetical protein
MIGHVTTSSQFESSFEKIVVLDHRRCQRYIPTPARRSDDQSLTSERTNES